ncbi:MAG: phosphoribosylaminoimidazolesuccinocarboxamide synthase [Eubacteriales bacterium]|nr:phosphoribosylaminoimidazolesuccinocarboxamide synthase [Christensenellaceae bacterium]MDY2750686.1 phosphoribosylaminoimidazolesuccinocarboxamide synthase [Eubacteriales bacterium]MCI7582996.1 phosphoribosylaminoimidazolesuccinocarboxamide synthase [Christensenellaceae bacterium]MCI7769516.1 phosphoribosylaminoimidazolesuccinocarboxamide synthase [Christensenellaceae bacterium]MDD6360357.1 phosphoribosylaminoimidazolesuccinocarboxamide synthase [Christensenellaceae bacterium]
MKLLYEGKAKEVFSTDDPDKLIIKYKNSLTAGNGAKKADMEGKGALNCRISNIIFGYLESNGVPTHFVREIDETAIEVKKVEIVPLEVIVRNVAAGSFSKRYGVEEGSALKCPVLEYSYKCDELGDPLINDYHIMALGLATREELDEIAAITFRVNELLKAFFDKVGVRLIDFKIELGRYHGKIILADEISPDSCRLWEKGTDEKLDKDRFRRDMGGVLEAYEKILKKIDC